MRKVACQKSNENNPIKEPHSVSKKLCMKEREEREGNVEGKTGKKKPRSRGDV